MPVQGGHWQADNVHNPPPRWMHCRNFTSPCITSCTDYASRSIDEIDDAVPFHGDVLLREHLDGFLCDHASEKGCRVGQLGGWCAGAGRARVRENARSRRLLRGLQLSEGIVERLGQLHATADHTLYLLPKEFHGRRRARAVSFETKQGG